MTFLIDQTRINNIRFFELLAQAFQKDLEMAFLRGFLFNAAWQTGYKNLLDALTHSRNAQRQSALTHAYLEQDFKRAQLLIKLGAPVGPQERAAYALALDSSAARAFGLSNPNGEKFHIVKRFGLTLGIEMTSEDGTFSQYGHSAPTYKMLTESVRDYAHNHPENAHFQNIASAFQYAYNTAQYVDSTATNPYAGKTLAARIQYSKAGTVTTVPTSCKGHEMALSFVSDGQGGGYMIFTNRGKNATGTQIFKMNSFSNVTPAFINNMLNGHNLGLSLNEVKRQIYQVAGTEKPEYIIKQKRQKRQNCTIANPRANMQGILLCLTALEQNKSVSQLENAEKQTIQQTYKQYSHEMRLSKVKELASALVNNPYNADLNNLAKAYLDQHPHAPLSLRAPLLKALQRPTKCPEPSTMDSLRQRSGSLLKAF